MSEQQSEHLSNAQIEAYGERTSGAGPEQDERNEGQRVDAHLDDCPSCRARVLDFQRTRLAPQADPQVLKQAPTPDCPSEDDLRQLAAGLCSDALAAQLTRHAATCDHCGPLLRAYTEDFSDDFSPEEQAVLANLKSSSASWQKETARQMLEAASGTSAAASARAASSAPSADGSPSGATATTKPDKKSSTALERKPFSWKWILVPSTAPALAATAIICGAVGFGVWYARRDTPEKVEKLLAQAYTEQRNVKMRAPYAKYSEFHQRRSGEPIPYAKLPKSFRKASDAISNHLEANPDDPEWLLLSARLDLLNWQYKPALSTLEKIENKDPAHQSEIDMVRALALYERAEDDADPQEYGPVIELLKKVLEKSPNDPVALHNQAVACEKAHINECAIEDWNRLLAVEKDPGWAGEARQHLAQIQEKKNPALTPSPK
jgi:tetratricopeptide (TPR) repeat protein